MREITVQVHAGEGDHVASIARDHGAKNWVRVEGQNSEGTPVDILYIYVSNRKVEGVLEALEAKDLRDVRIALRPQAIFPLDLSEDEAPEQVIDVEARSPLEILLGGLQSIGSWKGFLGYAAAGSLLVWIGLFTNSLTLLIAAMLIAPFAGPAMNVALATAHGDRSLLLHSLARYFAALLVTVLLAAGATWIFGQQAVTTQMVDLSQTASLAPLLPLILGAAGAFNLTQSDRSSLVPGTATGMLVAASLAPPSGLIGIALVLEEWAMARTGIFLVLLQLAGINLTGTLIFRLFGVSAEYKPFGRPDKYIFPVVVTITAAAFVGLLAWQFSNPLWFERASLSQRAVGHVQEVVDTYPWAETVEVSARFTRSEVAGQNSLLIVVYAQLVPDALLQDDVIRAELRDAIDERLAQEEPDITPLVNLQLFQSLP
jgi:uncharacterized hydrophobic protein (TIGR00271 family)